MQPQLPADEELLEYIKSDEEWAFELLFERYFMPLCRYAKIMVECFEDVEELVVDTFMDIWKRRKTLSIDKGFSTYIYAAVKYNAFKKVRQTGKIETITINEQLVHESLMEEKEALLNYEKKRETLYEAINNLPRQCQLIFTMSKIDGLKYVEIAESLGISVKTVENQMGKALKLLRNHFVPKKSKFLAKTFR